MDNVIVTGGGTGGHLFAALAFCDYLKKQGYNPIFIGSKYGLEKEILKNYKYEYLLLSTKGFAGKSKKEKIYSIISMIASTYKAYRFIKQKKALFSIGFGGYTSAPVVIASKILNLKIAIVEQNAVAGKANRVLLKIADFIFLNFESTKKMIDKKNVFVTGCPIRNDIYVENRNFDKDKFTIGVLGGSRGAKSINSAMVELAKNSNLNIDVIHQTGMEGLELVKSVYKKHKPAWQALGFIDDMKWFYENIDFIVCRAGAGTVSEITCAGLGALLIPYPYAIYNHQYYNAKELENAGCALIIDDKKICGKSLESIISSLGKRRLRSLSINAKTMCKRDVCSTMLSLIKTNS
jgi:UDP-N-acetylglucosamine--N-acetylmuramyl-(pentapeptide) pyrophosphoryl-undecaprenol N-acetylglucosamine transferase